MKTKHVIIIGAGLGGLSAAWELTRRRSDLQVDVYEASWVPGGKAASGRSPDNSCDPRLIEEHGLHMLFGTYRKTWRMLADCYSADDLPVRPVSDAFRRIEQAFTPGRRVVFDQAADGNSPRQHWVFCPDENPGQPWDQTETLEEDGSGGGDEDDSAHHGMDDPDHLGDIALRAVACCGLQRHTRSLATAALRLRGPAARPLMSQPAMFGGSDLDDGQLHLELSQWSKDVVAACAPARRDNFWLPSGSLPIEQILRLAGNARRLGELIDLGLAILAGTQRLRNDCCCDVDECRCFDQLNDLDLRQWLGNHGWNPQNDAIVRGFYAGLFARPGQLAAGVGLRAMLRVLFDYRGALVYRMEAGMGEVVVAPVYRALRARGVRFHFLQRLSGIEVTGQRIAGLTFERLGDLPPEYSPLVEMETLNGTLMYLRDTPPSSIGLTPVPAGEARHMHRRWPTDAVGRDTIPVDRDTHVILAIPPAALRPIAGPLRNEVKWSAFLDGPSATRSVPIASVQLWRKIHDPDSNPIRRGVAAGHTPPFDVWADMSHLLSRESMSHDSNDVAFFCGQREGTPAPSQAAEVDRVGQQFEAWLQQQAPYMMGRPVDLPKEERHRYVAANLDPSDEYVLSLPGTIERRIRNGQTGFDNLGVAGDWVKNDLDCGCVESAVAGGIFAAQAIP